MCCMGQKQRGRKLPNSNERLTKQTDTVYKLYDTYIHMR